MRKSARSTLAHSSRTRARACGNVLVLEPSADGGGLKTGRKGCGTFEVVVGGRAAHAGLEPENGVNALVETAHQVLAINGIGRADVGTTVTPTVASAGTADNVIPAEARIKVDVRVESADEKDRVEAAMRGLAVGRWRQPRITVLGGVNRPPMPESASASLFPLAEQVSPGIAGFAVGGGSDGNFTAAIGVPTLDGLGAVGGGAHADTEHIVVCDDAGACRTGRQPRRSHRRPRLIPSRCSSTRRRTVRRRPTRVRAARSRVTVRR